MLNNTNGTDFILDSNVIVNALDAASKKIAPLWPLDSFVAVNPYLGLSDQSFESVAKQLSGLAGIQTTMKADYYLKAIKENKLLLADLETVLQKRDSQENLRSFVEGVKNKKNFKHLHSLSIQTVAELAQKVTTANWPDFMIDSISSWASCYYDKSQVQWNEKDQALGLFGSWKVEAETNRAPSLMGLKGFHKVMKALPNNHVEAVTVAFKDLGIDEDIIGIYLHGLLLRLGGWSSYIAHFDWDNNRYGRPGAQLSEFLSVLICWEYGVYKSSQNAVLESEWKQLKVKMRKFSDSISDDSGLQDLLILQEAFDLTAQRRLIDKFHKNVSSTSEDHKTKVQAVFCIDVRSEVYRRNLESVAPEVDTLGFAGFFGFPINFRKLGHDEGFDQCPALIPSSYTVAEHVLDESRSDKLVLKRKLDRIFNSAWKTFKSSAISSFGFVSPLGLTLLPKLFTDSFGFTRPVPHPNKNGLNQADIESLSVDIDKKDAGSNMGIPIADRVTMAKGALQAMSLTENFARVVMIVGHGSTSVNNPHASGLDCGACAGQSGEANAKVAALILNDKVVRKELEAEKINIPTDTYFLACLHDTTIDEVSLFNVDKVPDTHSEDLENIKTMIHKAGKAARAERVLRMSMDGSSNVDSFIKSRSNDWSQVRPEWGLAGCSSFVVAPRPLTRGLDLAGRAFLHSYNWKEDREFKVLEAIMTAPMVVTSWINLQYFGSTVDNKHFGSGNKTLHNVTSGIGVLEGYAGDLRSGLPMQSIHDGADYQHEPLRLNVVINAPKDAMIKVLKAHDSVRQLCDNQWIFLLAMNDDGQITDLYDGNLSWKKLEASAGVFEQNKSLIEELV